MPEPAVPTAPAILLADDDPSVCRALARALRPLRCPLFIATTAEEALQTLHERAIGVMLCEPHNAALAAVLVRAQHEHPEMVRMILTGYPNMTAVMRAINDAQPFKLLCKPWDDDELRTLVGLALAQYQRLSGQSQQLAFAQSLQANAERTHAFRALAAVAQATPTAITEAAISQLAVGAMLLRNGFLIETNACGQRQLHEAQGASQLPGTPLDELTGIGAALLALTASATLDANGQSERLSWRGADGLQFDAEVKEVALGRLVLFARAP